MPAPLSNLMSAIDAPVSSLRQSIFSEMPLSDFSRHGIASDWMRISWRLGAPSGSCVMEASIARVFVVRRSGRGPGDGFHLYQAREIRHVRCVGQPVHFAHVVDEDIGAGGLVGGDLPAGDRLDLVGAAAQREHEVRMIVDMEAERFSRLKLDLPDAYEVVLQENAVADLAQRDAALGRHLESVFVVHPSDPGLRE